MGKQTFSKKEYLITVALKRELVGSEQVAIILKHSLDVTGTGPAGVWAYCDVTNGQHTAPKDIVVSVDIGYKPMPALADKKGTKN